MALLGRIRDCANGRLKSMEKLALATQLRSTLT